MHKEQDWLLRIVCKGQENKRRDESWMNLMWFVTIPFCQMTTLSNYLLCLVETDISRNYGPHGPQKLCSLSAITLATKYQKYKLQGHMPLLHLIWLVKLRMLKCNMCENTLCLWHSDATLRAGLFSTHRRGRDPDRDKPIWQLLLYTVGGSLASVRGSTQRVIWNFCVVLKWCWCALSATWLCNTLENRWGQNIRVHVVWWFLPLYLMSPWQIRVGKMHNSEISKFLPNTVC